MLKRLGQAAVISLTMLSTTAQSSDWHCLKTTSQTSVDFEGKAISRTCMPFTNLDAATQVEEKKKCEKGSRKNKAKAWLEGACPTKDRIGTCTVTKMGPATLARPLIIHSYEEQGGNLSLENEVNLARQQCAQLSLNSGQFRDVSSKTSSALEKEDSETDSVTDSVQDAGTSDTAKDQAEEQKQEAINSQNDAMQDLKNKLKSLEGLLK